MSWFEAAGNFLSSAQGQAGMALGGKIYSSWQSRENFKDQSHFAEEMSNTSITRRVQDLLRAGLNPILAAQDGASTPQTQFGQVGDFTDVANSVQSASRLSKERELIQAQIENLTAQTDATRQNANKSVQETLGVQIENETKTANLKLLAEDLLLRRAQLEALETTTQSNKYGQVREGLEADLYTKYPWLLNVEKGADVIDKASQIIKPGTVIRDVIGDKAPKYDRKDSKSWRSSDPVDRSDQRKPPARHRR